jgi:hypothetical protein
MLAFPRLAKAIATLSRQADVGSASWMSVRSALLEAADELRTSVGQVVPPIMMDEIAAERGIRIEFFRNATSPEAVLEPVLQGFRLRLRPGSQVRNRFSAAHEIGHTFFYDLALRPPTRLIAWNPSGGPWHKEEDLCNAFARELLMPRRILETEKASVTHSTLIDLVQTLASRFVVSPEAMVIRLMRDLGELAHTVAILSKGPAGSSQSRGKLRRYWGKEINQARLRKTEREGLMVLSELLSTGPPFPELDDFKSHYRTSMDIDHHLSEGPGYWNVMALVRLRDDRGPTLGVTTA